MRIDFSRKSDGFLNGFPAFARQPEDEGAMDGDAEIVAVLGEPPRDIDQHSLFDVVQDLLIARFVADQEQSEPVVAQDLQRPTRDIRLGIAGPRDAKLSEFAGNGLCARQVVGKGVVIEEELLNLGECRLRPSDLVDDVANAAGAVAMTADGLRPQAERAARFAASAAVEGDVGMLQIADEIPLNVEIPLVDRRYER